METKNQAPSTFIPKQKQNKVDTIDALAYLSLFLIVAVVIGFIVFHYVLIEKENTRMKGYVNDIATWEKQMSEGDQKANMLALKKKSDVYVKLLNSRTEASKIFEFVKQRTLPEIYYNNFEADMDGKTVVLGGISDTFQNLAKQYLIFKADKEHVNSITIKEVGINKEKGINFTFNVSLNAASLQALFKK